MSEALVVLARETVDIILLDLNLPDSNGIATVSEINEKALDIPIVVLTGTDDPLLGVEAIKAGAQDYLVKGKVTAGIFERVLRYALERHHARMLLRNSVYGPFPPRFSTMPKERKSPGTRDLWIRHPSLPSSSNRGSSRSWIRFF